MNRIDELLKKNEKFAESFTGADLPHKPSKNVAVLACMDCRMDIEKILGIEPGEANVFRNAGGIATMDALRSLIASHHKLGANEIIVINHTECGMASFSGDDFKKELIEKTGVSAERPASFHTITNLETNLKEQVDKIKSHPWIPDSVPVRGFMYDVKTGLLNEMKT